MNNLQGYRTRAFETTDAAEKYIDIKNLNPTIRQNYNNTEFINKTLCTDLQFYYTFYAQNDKKTENCSFDFSDQPEKILNNTYKMTDDEIAIDPTTDPDYKDNIFFHINFYTSNDSIGNVPKNITYEIIYNTTILN